MDENSKELDRDQREPLAEFLTALFSHDQGGFIEIRLIEDKKAGALVDRKWYPSIDALRRDLKRLNGVSDERSAAIFYGVLPRRADGVGKAWDTIPARVAWSDIDFKDFSSGEEEARRRLDQFPVKPSIVVRSGHGLHVYWLLTATEQPATLSELSKALAFIIGGDHTFDAARLLRLPGTSNRKDPEKPILVTVERLDSAARVAFSALKEAVRQCGRSPSGSARKQQPKSAPEIEIGGAIPESVLAVIQQNRRLKDLFLGHGKLPKRADGSVADTSSSGYDYSLLFELARLGVRDASMLATVLQNRPDGQARSKGRAYIARTVEKVLQSFDDSEEGRRRRILEATDFTVTRFLTFDSDPASYEMTVEGKQFVLTSKDLSSPKRFKERFLDALHRVPRVPSANEWQELVNGWLSGAEIVEQPPEASNEAALRDAIVDAVQGLADGEQQEDLDRGTALLLEDRRRAFKAHAILRILRESAWEVTRQDVCRVFRVLGFKSDVTRIGARSVRVWIVPAVPPTASP